jgi:glycosyltransferase involved in cell wall biosynthesis
MFYSRKVNTLKPGVNIFGYVFAEHGVGEEARLLIQIVQQAGLDFAVIPYTETFSRQAVQVDDLGLGEAVYDTNLICVNADAFPYFMQHFGSGILEGRYNIGLWAWEVAELPAAMACSAQFLDEIWGCSAFTAKAIEQVVPLPVFVLPPAIPISYPAPCRRQNLGFADNDFIFLFCFDFNSIFERKNAMATIAAFKLAFRPGQGARLLIKTINGNEFQTQLQRLRSVTVECPDIRVVDGYLQRDEQRSLINACDAYISLHRAEGFGLTLAEAMALGKPVIATGYSGNLDYMSDANSYLVPYQLVSIPPGCDPYPPTSQWAEPNVDAAASLMRRVFEDRDEARERARKARKDIARWHSSQERAKLVRRRFDTIHRGTKVGGKRDLSGAHTSSYTVIGYDPRAAEHGLSIDAELERSREQRINLSHRAFESLQHLLALELV